MGLPVYFLFGCVFGIFVGVVFGFWVSMRRFCRCKIEYDHHPCCKDIQLKPSSLPEIPTGFGGTGTISVCDFPGCGKGLKAGQTHMIDHLKILERD